MEIKMTFKMAIGAKENRFRKIAGKNRAYLLLGILIILAANLTACKSGGAEDISGVSEEAESIAQDAVFSAADGMTSTSEIPDEKIPAPETYEDYLELAAESYNRQDWEGALVFYQGAKELDGSREEAYRGLSDVCLQMDDVLQALAILDEGIDKCGIDLYGQNTSGQSSLSQRMEYVLAGMVAIRTKIIKTDYGDDGSILSGSTLERDENGNEIKEIRYGTGGEISYVAEYQYDGDGNKTEYKVTSYDSDGNSSPSSHWTWVYDADGNEIEFVSYDADGNIEIRTAREYDAAGNVIKDEEYDENGRCTEKIMTDYDERGNQIKCSWYDSSGRVKFWYEKEYDENGNEIKYVYYKNATTISFSYEREYDENGKIIKDVHYKGAETLDYWIEYEYDENGNRSKVINYKDAETIDYWTEYKYDGNKNQIKVVSCDGEGCVRYMYECEYGENERTIYEKSYDNTGSDIDVSEREYDESGNDIKKIDTSYDGETGQKKHQTLEEYAYDENKNITKYAYIVYDEEKGTDRHSWERKYDEDGMETAFCLYGNETTVSYQSSTEYDENGRIIIYTSNDKNGNVLVKKETEYDISGRVIRENEYDADGNLIQYYENEYDDCGNMIRQAMYEGNVLKSEKKMNYVYRYIGNIDAETADYLDSDTSVEEYNLKQREIFARFLNGQEKVRYRSKEDSVEDGEVVRDTIRNLIDFAYCRQNKEFPEYTFLDMTGDGIEELIISCGRGELYVVQNDHGILKIIFNTIEYNDAYLVEYNGRVGVCVSFSGYMSRNEAYYFFGENGKENISLDVNWDSEGGKSYRTYDNNCFNWHSISEGEYYDITEMMMTEIAIDWQELEEPDYGND